MFPGGLNPKQMEKMMKRMGIKMEEVDAEVVIIRGSEKEIIVENPQVIRTNMGGREMFQVSGLVHEQAPSAPEVEISEEDVVLVAEQAGVSKEKAREALQNASGDLAEAILKLKK